MVIKSGGVKTFLLQRLTAAYTGLYLIVFMLYAFSHGVIDFYSWHSIFHADFMRIATLLFFLSLMIHTWIGLRLVITDYIKDTAIRLLSFTFVFLVLFGSFLWSIFILWS